MPHDSTATSPAAPGDVEQRLLRLAASGDRAAFAELYDRLARVVHASVLRVVRDPSMTEEVVQEVFVELWRTARRHDPELGSVRTWALTLAHRRAVDRVRSEQSLRDRTWRAGVHAHRVPHDTVAEHVQDEAERTRVLDAVAGLSALQRQSIEMAYLDGRTYREVAEELRVPVGTVRTRMRDGMRALRTALGVSR